MEKGGLERSGAGDAEGPGPKAAGLAARQKERGKRTKGKGQKQGDVDVERSQPQAVEQTGPGLPTRIGSRVDFEWSDAVPADHRVRLWVLPPWVVSLLVLVHLLAAGLLAWFLLAEGLRRLRNRTDSSLDDWVRGLVELSTGSAAAAITCVAVSLGATAIPTDAVAAEGASSVPPEHALDELRSRLVDAHSCEGSCLEVPRMRLRVDGQTANGTLQIHAQRPVAVPLPGTRETLRVSSVEVDGARTTRWRGSDDGVVVRVEAGSHEVSYTGSLPKAAARHRLYFELSGRGPRHLDFASDDWELEDGSLRQHGRPRQVVTLVAADTESDGERGEDARPGGEGDDSGVSAGRPAPWYDVSRKFTLGLPWRVETTVRRRDTGQSTVLNYPLLKGETVASPRWETEEGRVTLEFQKGVDRVSFTSKLESRERLELQAPTDESWTETWTVECTTIWHCSFSDLPAVSLTSSARYRPTWRPAPGDELAIQTQRPTPVEGHTMTVRRVDYVGTVGERIFEGSLVLDVRASQGAKRTVELPAAAELQSLEVDGEERSNRSIDDGELTFDVSKGKSSVSVRWKQPWKSGAVDRLPPVELEAPAANVATTIEYADSEDQIILGVGGPNWGTISTLWLHLVWISLLAIVFGRVRRLPLATWEWLILAVGFIQLQAYTYGVGSIFLCFVLFGLRDAVDPPEEAYRFNLLQAVLVLVAAFAAFALYSAGWTNFFDSQFDSDLWMAGQVGGMLSWYVDSTSGSLPRPWVLSAPIWTWRIAGILWAGWVLAKLPGWGSWIWERFRRDGMYREMEILDAVSRPSWMQATDAAAETTDEASDEGDGDSAEGDGDEVPGADGEVAESDDPAEGGDESAGEGEAEQATSSSAGAGSEDGAARDEPAGEDSEADDERGGDA